MEVHLRQFVFFLFSLVLGLNAWSARTVNIVNVGNDITITNPSTVSVGFDVRCFNGSGTETVTQLGETLSPNASKTYGKSVDPSVLSNADACTGTAATFISMGSASCGSIPSFKACPDAVTFANAESACAPGTSPCEYNDVFNIFCAGANTFWMNPPTSGTLQFSTDSGTTFNNADLTTNGIVLVDSNCTFQCKFTGSAANGCKILPKTESHGVMCCAGKVPNFCKVTVNSTDANAFLASPGFKGGAPF